MMVLIRIRLRSILKIVFSINPDPCRYHEFHSVVNSKQLFPPPKIGYLSFYLTSKRSPRITYLISWWGLWWCGGRRGWWSLLLTRRGSWCEDPHLGAVGRRGDLRRRVLTLALRRWYAAVNFGAVCRLTSMTYIKPCINYCNMYCTLYFTVSLISSDIRGRPGRGPPPTPEILYVMSFLNWLLSMSLFNWIVLPSTLNKCSKGWEILKLLLFLKNSLAKYCKKSCLHW